jgi:nucleoside-diphosphate-sugar epimerase
MQTILGSNGTIGTFIAKELPKYTDKVRLVSRNPQKVNADDELVSLDLLEAEKVSQAVKGSEVVYLTVGIVYKLKEWNRQWEIIMRNAIHACKKHDAKLVFFDNVYPYGKVDGWMTEETPINPCSEKGKIRARLDEMIMYDVERGNLQAIIARAADFYGPDTPLSFANVMVIENYLKGKKAQWMIDENKKHSFTYTPDAAKATALLGNNDSAYNQVWHLPIDKNALTGKEFMELAARACGVEPKYTVLKKWMIQMAGIFNHNIKETIEMLYQVDSDYLFDSTKFDKAFNFKTTTYQEGIEETVRSYE